MLVTAKLICVFVFAYAKCWFSHDAAHIGREQDAYQIGHMCQLTYFIIQMACIGLLVTWLVYSAVFLSPVVIVFV